MAGSTQRTALLLFVGTIFVAISLADLASAAQSGHGGCGHTCDCPTKYRCTSGAAKNNCCWSSYSRKCNKFAGSFLTDEHNCGKCGYKCDHGKSCCKGYCVSSSRFQSDADNCGECGKSCGHGKYCCKGHCVSSSSFQTDKYNCGKCGYVCEHGKSCCKGECVSRHAFYSDKYNCGSCGNACKHHEICHKGQCKRRY